jgi:hypothetical protein
MNAEKALSDRQSVLVFGLKKLKVNPTKMTEFKMAKLHNPYAGASEWFIVFHLVRIDRMAFHRARDGDDIRDAHHA